MTRRRDYSPDYNVTTACGLGAHPVVTLFIKGRNVLNGAPPDYRSQGTLCSQGVVRPKVLKYIAELDIRLLTTLISHKENKREKEGPGKVYACATLRSSHA